MDLVRQLVATWQLMVLSSDSIDPSFQIALNFWKNLVDLGFQVLPKFFWALGILLLTRLAIGFVGRITRKALIPVDPTIRKFVAQGAELLTLIVGISAFLNHLGIQATSLVAVVGAAGLAIGLALQNTLSHFAAGVLLLSMRLFEVGDSIEGGGVTGVVDSIGIFSTTLLTPDNIKITVPNGSLFGGTLKNNTAMGTRRVDINVDIGSRAIAPTVKELLNLVKSHPLVLDEPQATCIITTISLENTVICLRPWCAAVVYEQVRSQIQQQVKEALQATAPPIDDA